MYGNAAARVCFGGAGPARSLLPADTPPTSLTPGHWQGRLRDLIAELLGPLRWSDRDLQQQQQPVGDAGLRAPGAGAAAHEPALASSLGGRWQPTILGYDKRKLLREVVLKEASKNRANQQLVAEVGCCCVQGHEHGDSVHRSIAVTVMGPAGMAGRALGAAPLCPRCRFPQRSKAADLTT